MLKLYIIGLTCVIFILVNVLYERYISGNEVNLREMTYNVIVIAFSVFGSFELINTVLPSLGVSLGDGGIQIGGKGINVFTNEPSF